MDGCRGDNGKIFAQFTIKLSSPGKAPMGVGAIAMNRLYVCEYMCVMKGSIYVPLALGDRLGGSQLNNIAQLASTVLGVSQVGLRDTAALVVHCRIEGGRFGGVSMAQKNRMWRGGRLGNARFSPHRRLHCVRMKLHDNDTWIDGRKKSLWIALRDCI